MVSNLEKILRVADLVLIDNGNNNDITVNNDPMGLVDWFVRVSVGIAVAAVIILVAVGGYKMSLSGGDAGKIKDGKEQIQNALLGFMLIAAAVTITVMILQQLGINLI